ncbi:protein-methionine-sulfoxide reductase heme-binding subunit MsrQ [Ruegeria sp. 2205SS24-7]|uniref:protein-methionine-sulfoxide reductase heme-binding subunit MsrQ n=1 Tax=Ruegeria discodermiae TaxID=3064389 RepID=UPI002741E258|nr:protein-methionine-sulfoxide reductase heme-binding subunit MsrQ [Ruegeria sp. 2205SS24-7]MDP5219134.1 protein-methionine-sulfoxide reductase heme-binding subunit MsrQ [Ruegeria sp. 2205SS24-7]
MLDRFNPYLRKLPVWAVYLAGVLPPVVWLWMGATGRLGVEPISALEHKLGEAALQLLILGLAVTPLRRYLGLNLIKFRRAIGVLAFFYVTLHLLVWLVLDVQVPQQIWADIVKRPYITVGMAGFLLLLPLALTSNDFSVRRLGPKWRSLHRLVYVGVVLGGLHYVMLVKGFQIEPLIYMAIIAVLLLLRLQKQSKRQAA